MSSEAIGGLVQTITILFILSLSVERVAELFKLRDWQPLTNLSKRPKIDLRTGVVSSTQPSENVVSGGIPSDEDRRIERATHAVNTILIGVLLALLTGANAFAGLKLNAEFKCDGDGVFLWCKALSGTWKVVQVIVTGAAAGIGSSFWYDMLRLVTEIRRAREAVADPKIGFQPLVRSGMEPHPTKLIRERSAASIEVIRTSEKKSDAGKNGELE